MPPSSNVSVTPHNHACPESPSPRTRRIICDEMPLNTLSCEHDFRVRRSVHCCNSLQRRVERASSCWHRIASDADVREQDRRICADNHVAQRHTRRQLRRPRLDTGASATSPRFTRLVPTRADAVVGGPRCTECSVTEVSVHCHRAASAASRVDAVRAPHSASG
jgi:hypothetical protein